MKHISCVLLPYSPCICILCDRNKATCSRDQRSVCVYMQIILVCLRTPWKIDLANKWPNKIKVLITIIIIFVITNIIIIDITCFTIINVLYQGYPHTWAHRRSHGPILGRRERYICWRYNFRGVHFCTYYSATPFWFLISCF